MEHRFCPGIYIYKQRKRETYATSDYVLHYVRTYVSNEGFAFFSCFLFFFIIVTLLFHFFFFLFFYFSFFRQESVTCSREKEDCALLVLPSLLPLFTGLFYQQKMIRNKKRRCGIRELAEKRVNACFDSHPVFSRTLLLKICAISFQSEIKRDSVPSHRTRLKERARH